jgi:hypothetical protein
VTLRASIDDLDVLIVELTELRQALSVADLHGNPDDALWDAEARLRHVAERATTRANIVRRAIDVLARERDHPTPERHLPERRIA